MHHFKVFYGDPITSLYLDDTVAAIGTALGMIAIYQIKEKKAHVIAQTSKELISAVKLM